MARAKKIYRPMMSQETFHDWPARFRAYIGGVGSGKTKAGVMEAIKQSQLQPGLAGAIVAPTYPMLRDATMEMFFESFPRWAIADYHKTDRRLQTVHGSLIFFRSADDPDSLRGPNLAWFFLDEAAKCRRMAWDILIGRIRVGNPLGWLATTPRGFNWVYDVFVKNATPHHAIIRAKTADNPYLDKHFMESLRASYTGIFARQELEGEFVQAEGVVYDLFTADNISEEADYDEERGLWELAYDDGYVDPRAMLFIQRDGNRIYVFDELYHSRHLPDVCIQEMVNKGYGRPDIAIGDPSARELRERFRQADVVARAGKVPIVEGIQVVRRLIRDGQGIVSLLVHPRCKNLIQEMTEGYKYPEGSRRDNEQPIDESNHACDALRYWAWARAR